MDLSELHPTRTAGDAFAPPGSSGTPSDQGWSVASQVGVEIATTLTSALDRMLELQRTGAIDRQGLSTLIDEVRHARRTSFVAQQLGRLARGGIQQQHEAVAVAQILAEVAAQHETALAAHGIALRQSVKPVEVVVDASLLASFVHAVLDWAERHARTAVELRLDTQGWPAMARLRCRFGHVPTDQADQAIASTSAAPPGELTHVDSSIACGGDWCNTSPPRCSSS